MLSDRAASGRHAALNALLVVLSLAIGLTLPGFGAAAGQPDAPSAPAVGKDGAASPRAP